MLGLCIIFSMCVDVRTSFCVRTFVRFIAVLGWPGMFVEPNATDLQPWWYAAVFHQISPAYLEVAPFVRLIAMLAKSVCRTKCSVAGCPPLVSYSCLSYGSISTRR